MESSLRFDVDGLGFTIKRHWIPDREEDHPDGRIRWSWLELGHAAIMIQEIMPKALPEEKHGGGVSVSFMCEGQPFDRCYRTVRLQVLQGLVAWWAIVACSGRGPGRSTRGQSN